jgi:hypothetical protein
LISTSLPSLMSLICLSSSLIPLTPAPETAWKVVTIILFIFEYLFNSFIAVTAMVVEQFGFAIIPLCFLTSSPLTSGTTKGTSSSSLYALELSITTAPAFTAAGDNFLLMSFSAAQRTTWMFSKDVSFASSISYFFPLNSMKVPALLLLARSLSSFTGKFLSSKTFSISCPTAPVAPSIARLYFFISSLTFCR